LEEDKVEKFLMGGGGGGRRKGTLYISLGKKGGFIIKKEEGLE
jgi:hypothetical protein